MATNFTSYLANAKKAIIQVTGLVGALCALGILPAPYSVWAATALGVLTTVSHYLVANADAPGTTPALEDFEPPADDDPDEPIPDEFKPAELVTAGQVASNNEIAAPPTT